MKTFYEWLVKENNISLKGPSGSPVKYFFKTSQGSMYILTEKGESRRIKSVHANTGGEDAGLHSWNQKCVFVPPEDEIKGNSMQYLRNNYDGPVMLSVQKPNKLTFLMIKNNQWSPVLFKDAYTKSSQDPKFQSKSNDPMEFNYVKEPTMGYNVCEWNEKGNRLVSGYHFGSPVSEIKDINDVDPQILAGFMDNSNRNEKDSQNKQPDQSTQVKTNQAFSLSSIAGKMGDPDWHQLYDVFSRKYKHPAGKDEANKIGKALFMWAQGNKKDAEPFLDKYVRAQKIR